MEKRLARIEDKLDKVISSDAKKRVDIESRISKAEVKIGLHGKVMTFSIIALLGSYFAIIKTKLGM